MVGVTEHGLVNYMFYSRTIISISNFVKKNNRGEKKENSEKQSQFSVEYLVFGKQTIPRQPLQNSQFLLLHLYYMKNIFVACFPRVPKVIC